MRIECHDSLDEATAAEWRAFLAMARHHHVRQDPRFAEVERTKGNSPIFMIGRREDGTICAVAWFLRETHPLLPGRFALAKVLSGPVCDNANEMMAFLKGLADHPVLASTHRLSITPYWLEDEAKDLARRLGERGWYPSDPDHFRKTGLIDLTRPEAEIRESFSRSARRKLRLVEKSEIAIRRIDRLAEAEIFFERLNRLVLARIGAPMLPPAEYPLAIEHRPGDFAETGLFGAFIGDIFLGGLLVNRGGRFAHAHRYVADPDAAQKFAGNLRVAPSIWLAGMLWAKAEGCTVFDVEGFQEIEDPGHPYFNVYEYKRELGPIQAVRLREHSLPIKPVLHALDRLPSRMRNAVSSYMPPASPRQKR